jgi:3D (Asp-Asp-Asp) domain-containing protein
VAGVTWQRMTSIATTAVTGVFLLQTIVPVASALVTEPVEATPEQPTYVSHVVSMTAYNAVPGQTDSTPTRTSIGAYTNPDIIAARSVDLADELPYGTVIEIVPVSTSTKPDHKCGREYIHEQIGYRVIADAMNARMRNKIDILLDHKEKVSINGKKLNPARVFGVCKNVEIRVVGKIDTKHMPKSQNELKLALEQSEIKADENLAVRE